MPDTYISQFSGEEIDSALRAAQMISGASTPAELREKLEIRGDTIPVSAGDSTLISEALTKIPTTSGGGVNPNLLDNWYFGRPVNQRNGYIVPTGVDYYTFAWEKVGQTDKNYPVLLRRNAENNYDCEIEINGTRYVVAGTKSVPGYCTSGYTIDRWKALSLDGTVTCENDCLAIENTNGTAASIIIDQIFEPDLSNALKGKTLTLSVMVKSVKGKFTFQSGDKSLEIIKPGLSHLVIPSWVDKYNYGVRCFNSGGAGKIEISAVKLELGDTQTLAHKDSSGNWVLNEIPDFGEQLRRCMYYAEKVESKDTPVITNSTFVPHGATSAVFILPYARKRTAPVISFNAVSNYRIIARNISGGTTAFSVTAISPLDVGRTKAAILVSFNATDQDYYCFLQRADNVPAGYAFVSADL